MRLTFLIVILFLAENFFLSNFFGARIEVLLLATLYFALKSGPLAGIFWGLGFGFLEEVLSSRAFGTILIPNILLGFLAGLFKERLYFENIWYSTFFIFIALLFGYLLGFALSRNFSFFMVLSAIVSAAISPILFFVINKITIQNQSC